MTPLGLVLGRDSPWNTHGCLDLRCLGTGAFFNSRSAEERFSLRRHPLNSALTRVPHNV
jgi:hypothetical protein